MPPTAARDAGPLILALRAAGADLPGQIRALRETGLSFEAVLDALLRLEPDRREKARRLVEAVRGNAGLAGVRRVLEAHGIHPLTFALARTTQARVRSALVRLGQSVRPAAWAQYGGVLAIEGEGGLRALPRGLVVLGRRLRVTGCAELQDLGEGLDVEDLLVQDCPALEALPAGFRGGAPEKGLVAVHGCRAFRGFPADARLEGTVQVFDAPAFEGLPGDLGRLGCLRLHRAGGARPLPSGLKVDQDLELVGCPDLEELPPGLEVGRHLRLEDLPRLRTLPSDLRVGGHLTVRNCPALDALPAGLATGGGLRLEGLPALTELPPGLRATDLLVRGCGALEVLPADLSLGGSLILIGLEALRAWEGPATLPGGAFVGDCPRLARLPAGLRADLLHLEDLPALEALPEGLRLARSLHLHGCPGLRDFPAGPAPAPKLEIKDCDGLETLPAFEGGLEGIHLERCRNLRRVDRALKVATRPLVLHCWALREAPAGWLEDISTPTLFRHWRGQLGQRQD